MVKNTHKIDSGRDGLGDCRCASLDAHARNEDGAETSVANSIESAANLESFAGFGKGIDGGVRFVEIGDSSTRYFDVLTMR